MKKLLSPEIFVGEEKILVIRGLRVMLDKDLAALYGVKPIALRQQVKRNSNRFPPDFMFQLTKQESENLVSQFVIPSMRSFGGSFPLAFTQEGAAALSGVRVFPGGGGQHRNYESFCKNENYSFR